MKRMSREYRAKKRKDPDSTASKGVQPPQAGHVVGCPGKTKSVPTHPPYTQGYFPAIPTVEPSKPSAAKRRRLVYYLILAALACVFIFASYQVIRYFVKSHQAIQEEQMVQALIAANDQSFVPAETDEHQPTNVLKPLTTAQPAAAAVIQPSFLSPEMPEILQKFSQALSINPDTVGQLQMGESINTYIVQRDNTYYLRRSFTGEYSFSGAAFLDVTCSIYPQSRVMILHGHNMHDGTAFGKLSRFDNIDYLNEYPFIKFSTLYDAARYIPFAVVYYSIDPQSDLYLDVYQINLMSDDAFAQFVSKVKAMSEYRLPVMVAKTDTILMVTTCADDADMRFAVFAVKSDTI